MVCCLVQKYCAEEGLDRLPIENVIFTDNIADEIKRINPKIVNEHGFDESRYHGLTGNVQCFEDNTAIILFDKLYFEENYAKNYLFIETLYHEITHVADYYSNIGIMGTGNMYELMRCRPFWYWSEFHAKYKGTVYMLKCVSKLPDKYQKEYPRDVSSKIKDFEVQIIKAGSERINIYSLLHIMGESIAYKQSGFEITSFESRDLIEFENYLTNLTARIDIAELLNLKRIVENFKIA